MSNSVDNGIVPPEEKKAEPHEVSDKSRENFARLEAAKQAEKEARIRAEMEREFLKKQLEEIKAANQPVEKDPLDELDDEFVDKQRLQLIRQKDKAAFKREAEEIANRIYEAKRQEDDKKNFLPKLRGQFDDYDKVMTETNIAALEEKAPAFLKSVMKIDDDYERRLLTYEYLKANRPRPAEETQSIKERVEENQKNPYYVAPATGTPNAMEYDLRSKSAREAAYAKLKAAQRRPLGSGVTG